MAMSRFYSIVLCTVLANPFYLLANEPVTITVHPEERQTFMGFGASSVEWAYTGADKYANLPKATRDRLVDLFWGRVRGRSAIFILITGDVSRRRLACLTMKQCACMCIDV